MIVCGVCFGVGNNTRKTAHAAGSKNANPELIALNDTEAACSGNRLELGLFLQRRSILSLDRRSRERGT